MNTSYRGDIDGLRAISVILVILFHLGVPHVSGGFVGVDVFFVISGFLITGIIYDALEARKFSFTWFYDRRARRILPALLSTIIASVVAGYVLLYPGDYQMFARSAISAVLAASNIFFLNNTGYFDIPSQSMPLLHTWSLAVEEQFYLFWPAILLVAHKFFGGSKTSWRIFFGSVIAASFLVAIFVVETNAKAAFYLPHTRAWELALGALIVFIPVLPIGRLTWLREASPLVGLALIFYSAATLSAQDPFPGTNALLPVGGAALIIHSGGETAIARRLLAIVPMRFIGLISYSLYLWHWPLIVFWRVYTNGLPISPMVAAAIGAATVVLSLCSWWLIEQPARRTRASPKAVLSVAIGAQMAVLLLVAPVLVTEGLPARVPPDMLAIVSKEKMWTWPCPRNIPLGLLAAGDLITTPSCAFGADWRTARNHAVIWGDSIAEALAPVLDYAGREADTAIALAQGCAAITQPGAPRIIGVGLVPQYDRWCDAARTRVLSLLTEHNNIDFVLLSTSWSHLWPLLRLDSEEEAGITLKDGLNRLLAQIIAGGKRPIVIADLPASLGPDPTSCVMAHHALPRQPCTVDPVYIDLNTIKFQVTVHNALRDVVRNYPTSLLIDPIDFLCDKMRCSRYVAGEFIYRDAVHLRRNLKSETVAKLVDLMHLDKAFDDNKR